MANFPITITKGNASILPIPERTGGFDRMFRVNFADLVASGSTGSTDTVTVTLGTTPTPAWIITRALASINTAFAGTIGGLAVTVGVTGSVACVLPSTSVLSGAIITSTAGANAPATVSAAQGTTAVSIVAVFTASVSGGMNALTAGQIDIFVSLIDPTKINGPYTNQ